MAQKVSWIIQKAFLESKRKATAPAIGTTKYNALLGLVDTEQKAWESEPDTEWDSLYSLVTIGTVTATDTFDLDDTINYISKREGDYVLVTNGTNTIPYQVVRPNQLYSLRSTNACAQIGRTLKFSKAFVSTDSAFGYSIKIPSILYVDDITLGTQFVQCDDSLYLVYAVAATFCANDTVKAVLYDKLLAKAGQRMERMKQANSGQNEVIATPWSPEGITWN